MFNLIKSSLIGVGSKYCLQNTAKIIASYKLSPCQNSQILSSNFHTSTADYNKRWRAWKPEPSEDEKEDWFLDQNKVKFPPVGPDEPPRHAFVCHARDHIKYHPKKMWYVAHLIRGLSIDDAINQLKFIHKRGAVDVLEVLLEAQEIAVREHNVEFPSNLWVSESFCYIDMNIKSGRRHAKGRMGVITHRYVRYCVKLEEGTPPKDFYFYRREKEPQEHIQEWITELRQRQIPDNI